MSTATTAISKSELRARMDQSMRDEQLEAAKARALDAACGCGHDHDHGHEHGHGHHHHQHAAQAPVVRSGAKIGRNDPCPCGSGKKHKKCCL